MTTPGNCESCWHLWTLHGPDGCTAKVYPSHSLQGEPCPCEHTPDDSAKESTMADTAADHRPYGDTHDERARELRETGKSVRRTGKGAFADLRDALDPEAERLAREQDAG